MFKVLVNPGVFIVKRVNEKSGEEYRDLRSTCSLSKEEMMLCIDRFKDHSAQGGLVLPDPENLVYLREVSEAIDRAKQYL